MPTSIFHQNQLAWDFSKFATVERCGSRMGTFKHIQEEIQKKDFMKQLFDAINVAFHRTYTPET